MQYDPNFLRQMDARTLAAVHDAARLRARELRAQAMDAFWSALLLRIRERRRTARRATSGTTRQHGACLS